jgi:ubiquinone/menaquinone biosynthesis C-methylase UbiE
VIGLDLLDGELAGEWDELGLPMFFGDATSLPFVDSSVDLVVGLEMLEHVPRPDRALREIARVCGGTAVLSVPREPIWRAGNIARGRYVRDLGNTPGHVNHWSARGFERFVSSRFDIVDTAKPLPWTMLRGTPVL